MVEGLAPEDASDPYLLLTSGEIAHLRKDFPTAEKDLAAVIQNARADSSLRWQAQSDLGNLYVDENESAKGEALFVEALHTVEAARQEIKQEDRRMSNLGAWAFYVAYIPLVAH